MGFAFIVFDTFRPIRYSNRGLSLFWLSLFIKTNTTTNTNAVSSANERVSPDDVMAWPICSNTAMMRAIFIIRPYSIIRYLYGLL